MPGARIAACTLRWLWIARLILLTIGLPLVTTAAAQTAAADFVPRWSLPTTGGPVTQPPVVAGDLVYFARQDGTLAAAELETGHVVWSAASGSGRPLGPTVADGVVYVANQDGALAAFDAQTGAQRWRTDGVATRGSAKPLVAAGRVLVVGFPTTGATLTALDATTGQPRWSVPLGPAATGAPAAIGDRVYVTGTPSGATTPQILAIDATTGTTVWTSDAATPLVVVVAADRLVYAVGTAGLVALAADTGAEAWTFRPGPNEPGGVWAVDGPTVADGVVYVGTAIAMGGNPNPSPSGMVYALAATSGAVRWAAEIKGGVAHGPVVAGSVVAVAAGGPRGLYALDATTGDVVWYRPQRTNTTAALAATADWLIVADQDGSVAGWQALAA